MIDYNEFCQNDITLRDYQQLAKEDIFDKWNLFDNILYQMPTGTGKTRLFTSIIRDINIWGLRHNINFRILIIAHRSELIEQSSRSLDKYRIKHGVLAGTMKDKRDLTQAIQVASIQTITHPANQCLIEDLKFDFIIIDEAHHAVASSYQKLWEFCPDAKKLGVTATPWRMNNNGFAQIFDAYIPSMSIKEFIQKGWLATYQYYSIPISSELLKSIDSIREFDIEGDYKNSALAEVCDTLKIRAQLYDSYAKNALGKKGIIYSISREHSEHICSQYQSHGVSIENIDSKTPAKVREAVINAFKNGEIDIIVNVDIFSEGFDCPDIEFIQLARPTKSLVKYIQQVGRGLRKNGDKRCIILDNVGMYSRFGLPDEVRDWESYFYGESREYSSSKRYSRNNGNIREYVETDLSEGDDEMVLIQDFEMPQTVEIDVKDSSSDTPIIQIKDISTQENNKTHHFAIRSKSFSSGKYFIEENENGFFIVNARNQNKMLLTTMKTMRGGVIIVTTESSKKAFTIIKTLSATISRFSMSCIVGTLHKEGLLLKFTAFDKSEINKTITV
ncbi:MULTISPECIES: DEAD/DEAH box helicase [Bacteroides]|jgi:superfamily II DNA or RNA helicase|uniref:DEAD/DEAH box helicase n=1 Tax=Bacteroides TaxID=816 RepID=UPI00164AE357|nr:MULTISPECIES: DEAD/DEAH box helicase [Bacteroides]MBC5587856.1 DEAD/DEAH box helicase [Bacteroides sp. NSJ-39]